jgi:tetratricopeptide (TPR) repeat protein
VVPGERVNCKRFVASGVAAGLAAVLISAMSRQVAAEEVAAGGSTDAVRTPASAAISDVRTTVVTSESGTRTTVEVDDGTRPATPEDDGPRTTVEVEGNQWPHGPDYQDGYAALVAYEARDALGKGNYKRAQRLFQILVRIDGKDAYAHRELGRTAHALGQLEHAADELARANRLMRGAPDPELHYLRGEALYGLDRIDEARAEHEQAEREIGSSAERMSLLWLARIYARRGELDRAVKVYRSLDKRRYGEPPDEEVALNMAEAHFMAKDWAGAEKVLRDFLAEAPRHRRAREMLAWSLEAQGRLDEEVEVRSRLTGWTGTDNWISYGRVLERARNYGAALGAYRQAYIMQGDFPDPQLGAAIDRMRLRLATEVGASAAYRTDPTGSALEYRAGVTIPMESRLAASFLASYETAEGGLLAAKGNRGSFYGSLLIALWEGADTEFHVGAGKVTVVEERIDGLSSEEDKLHLGTAARLHTPVTSAAQLDLQADFRSQWTESADTIRRGGHYSGFTSHLYLKPFGPRVVFDTGAQARWLSLTTLDDEMETPTASQLLLFGGVDVTVWHAPDRVVRGEILDRDMRRGTYLSDALVLGYRHYEAIPDTSEGFRQRLSLARARIDELSFTARKVLTTRGILGVEGRGGAGWDSARDAFMWRAGAGLELAATPSSRLSLSYDFANESATGLQGRRQTGWVTFHVDI